MGESSERRPLVPQWLLRRFADDSERVIIERRDRARRRPAPLAEAAALAGVYTVIRPGKGWRDLARLLDRIEVRSALVIERILAGAFPPRGEDRAYLASFIAVTLLLGGAQRALFAQTVGVLSHLLDGTVPEGEEGDEAADPALAQERRAESPRADVVVHDDEPVRLALSATPPLARLLAARTWQLLRFPGAALLTGDTPAVAWSPPGSATPTPSRIGAAAEVRVPLDPRQALVLARTAPSGEVIRDLGDRHARALNRTVADAARRWMFYHPASDPLAGVELDRT